MKLKEVDFEEWAELVNRHPGASLFHTREWLQILEEGFPHINLKLYVVLDAENETVGLLPAEFAQKGPFKLGGSPLPGLFTPYQGLLLLEPVNTDLKGVARLVAKASKAQYFALALPPNRPNEAIPKEPAGWELKKTFLLNLTLEAEQLWKNFKAETRNQVRQAQRRGVEIYEPEVLDDWIEDYYAMHRAVYLRQKIRAPGNRTFYQALWDGLYDKGQLKVILAKHKGKTIAGGVFPSYGDTIYFLDGVSFREHQNLRANNLIQWHLISWAATSGLRVYDMVGANIPSIAHFKRGFGGIESRYSYLQMPQGLLGKTGYHLYQRYRPFLKRMGI